MNDRFVVLPAVRQNYKVLEFVSKDQAKRFWADTEIVLSALEQDAVNAMAKVDEKLCGSKKVMSVAVQHCGDLLRYGNEEVRADRKVVQAAVEQDGMAIQYASEALRKD